jgi:hypothetical protein
MISRVSRDGEHAASSASSHADSEDDSRDPSGGNDDLSKTNIFANARRALAAIDAAMLSDESVPIGE